MAGVPCVNDTCGIISTVDANGRLDLNVRLSPTGGLVCVDGSGIGLSSVPAHLIASSGMAARVSHPASDVAEHTMTITNPGATDLLVVVDARYDFRFTYTAAAAASPAFASPGDPTPAEVLNIAQGAIDSRYYSFDIGFNLLFNNNPVIAGGAFAETLSGIGRRNSDGSDQRALSHKTAAVFTLPPGAWPLVMRSTRSANGAGTTGTIDSVGPSNGILMDIRMAILSLDDVAGLATLV